VTELSLISFISMREKNSLGVSGVAGSLCGGAPPPLHLFECDVDDEDGKAPIRELIDEGSK